MCARSIQRGFTLLELLIATAIFMVICAAMFMLLQISQQKYAIETQMSGSFQEARLGLDQIVRDINISGYPSANLLSNTNNPLNFAQSALPWSPNYPAVPSCALGACAIPTDSDLIIETNPNPTDPASTISWIRYQYVAPSGSSYGTLYRGVLPKSSGDPKDAFDNSAGVMTPLIGYVVNYASGDVLAQINTQYPSMLSGGAQALFTYTCSTPTGPQPCNCPPSSSPGCSPAPSPYNMPQYITDVDITLIVQTPQPDMQTGALKLIELSGRGHRTNLGN